MARATSTIEKLLRTNTALVFLCVISIGVLMLLFRHAKTEEPAPVIAPVIAPVTVPAEQASGAMNTVNNEEQVPPLASSVFRNGPVPDTLPTFIFKGQPTVKTTFTCTDVYDVALIYPMSIDYRLYPLSSLYNRATACKNGVTTSKTISLENVRTEIGSRYYIVRAHQGKKGSWYNPY